MMKITILKLFIRPKNQNLKMLEHHHFVWSTYYIEKKAKFEYYKNTNLKSLPQHAGFTLPNKTRTIIQQYSKH